MTHLGLFLLTVAVFGLAIAAMAVGVALGRKPIQGSCGGLGQNGLDVESVCGLCSKPVKDCPKIEGDAVAPPSPHS
ncbi:MAG: (Na+)-NQR maturation NqrM [Pirellulaceae bacterium]|jgi:hypothetical protein